MRNRIPLATSLPRALVLTALIAAPLAADEPLDVVTTTPDLAALVAEVGGDAVHVESLTQGPQDPHHLEAKPSFIRRLHDAGLFVQSGLELEIGWAPVLLRAARNPEILGGAKGHLDASGAVAPLRVPGAAVDRSAGDLHAMGNPHYLLDPLNGLRVAGRIREKLSELLPARKDDLERRFASFRRRLAAKLVGEPLVKQYDDELPNLIELLERGGTDRLVEFLREQNHAGLLGGWLGALRPHAKARVVADHDLWPYFAERFGIDVVGFLEPKPGIAPTTRHLTGLIEEMRAHGARAVLSAPYFGTRHADLVARETGAKVVPMAHQTGGRDGVHDYIELFDHNVARLVEALER